MLVYQRVKWMMTGLPPWRKPPWKCHGEVSRGFPGGITPLTSTDYITIYIPISTMWAPPVMFNVCWFINPVNYSNLRTINHSEVGVMFTNLAIDRGPHIVRNSYWWWEYTTVAHMNVGQNQMAIQPDAIRTEATKMAVAVCQHGTLVKFPNKE